MVETVTYWIRFNCAWRKVTTSLAKWAKLPHVVGSCKVVPALLTVLLLGPVTPAGVVPEDGRFTGGFEKLTSEETAIPSLEPSFSWPSGSGTAPGIGTASAAGAASEGGPDANDMNDMLVTDWSCVLPDPAIAVPEAAPDTPTNRAMCCDAPVNVEPIPEPPVFLIFATAVAIFCGAAGSPRPLNSY